MMSERALLALTSQELSERLLQPWSVEELDRYWKLSADEIEMCESCRGNENMIRFGLQLCGLKSFGCFLESYEGLSVDLLNTITHQLMLEPLMFLEPGRESTESDRLFMQDHVRLTHSMYEREIKNKRRELRSGLETILPFIKNAIELPSTESPDFEKLFQTDTPEAIKSGATQCQKFLDYDKQGELLCFQNRFSVLQRYFPTFLTLDFQFEDPDDSLKKALEEARKWQVERPTYLPASVPKDFIPRKWFHQMENPESQVEAYIWMTALALKINQALSSGQIYLKHSLEHRPILEAYQQSHQDTSRAPILLPATSHQYVRNFQEEINGISSRFPENEYARVVNNKLKVRKESAPEQDPDFLQFKQQVESRISQIRIEQMIEEVDTAVNFSDVFWENEFSNKPSEQDRLALYATLIAHGTNLGLATMEASAQGLNSELMRRISRIQINPSTLEKANARLINFHKTLPLTQLWGQGEHSSSDGQRFRINRSSMLANFYPRYFGYYDRAFTLYTHVSDQYSVYFTQAISCNEREAMFVLEGLLNQISDLNPLTHHTDTNGFTEQLFGLCYLFGIRFIPHIKNPKKQQLYSIRGMEKPANIASILTKSIDFNTIEEHWTELQTLANAIQSGHIPVNIFMKRLQNRSNTDSVAKALTQLGRLEKTLHILRYIDDSTLRRVTRKCLNIGEERHGLAKHFFFFKQGEFQTGDYYEIMSKSSCLSFLSNALVIWNTLQLEKVINQIKRQRVVPDEYIQKLSPLIYGHVIVTGMYDFNKRKPQKEVL